jgi:hypothetical protein
VGFGGVDGEEDEGDCGGEGIGWCDGVDSYDWRHMRLLGAEAMKMGASNTPKPAPEFGPAAVESPASPPKGNWGTKPGKPYDVVYVDGKGGRGGRRRGVLRQL